MTDVDRRAKAMQATRAVAHRLGMASVTPVMLKDSNHVSIRLAPFPVVARVATSSESERASRRLTQELSVAQHLLERGAPAIPPAIDVPAGPHVHGDMTLTLWQFVPHVPARDDDAPAAAEKLRSIHEALSSYPGTLPSFLDAVDDCGVLLQDPAALPALDRIDQAFLRREHDRLRVLSDSLPSPSVALHGDPHLGNALITSHGPAWTDLESACRGPIEWDLSCLPQTALGAFPEVDRNVLTLLDDLRSVCVATWCWLVPDRSTEKREAARFHLHRLRERAHSR